MKSGPFAIENAGLRVPDQTETMVQARLCVLGRFSLELGHVATRRLATQKARAVLAYLVAHRRSDVARERLLEVFWPNAVAEAAKDNLRSALWSIRRGVRDAGFEPNEYLVANRTKLRWVADSWYDAEAFLELAKSDDPIDLQAALALYQGDFIEGDYEEWTVAERARIGESYESVLARLVRGSRNHDAAQTLIARNPYDEASYLLLIEDELSSGRIAAAAALADRCEAALAEVGAQPSPDLQRLLGRMATRHLSPSSKPVLPFVGRTVELSTVRAYLRAPRAGEILLISGEAGIGKSAFLSRVHDVVRDLGRRGVTVQCFDTDSRLFGPFEELYAELHGRPFNPLEASQVPPAQRLAEALLEALDPSVLLCIDDAHTLTSDAWLVLCALTQCACAKQRAMIVATRTEGLQNVITGLNGCAFGSIALGPLNFSDLRAGIDLVVTDDTARVARTVFERSGGHPLFAVTLLDSLAQSGVLQSELGMWHLAGTLDEQISLPKSLRTYIEARLNSRGVIPSKVAAALGLEPAANADDLAAVLRLSEEQVFNAIDDLLSLGVLVQTDGASQLSFAHDLFREVAARTVNPGRRIRLHGAFGERFLSSSAADASLKSARHLALARDPMRAADAYSRAATEALESRAAVEARDRCAAGIAALDTLERRPDVDAMIARLKVLSARSQAALGDSLAAKSDASESIALAKRLGDSRTAIQGALARQSVIRDEYDASSALSSAREIASMATDAHDDASLAIALADQSWAHRLLGSEREALNAAHESESVAETLDNAVLLCYALEQRILAAITWWRFDEAVDIAARCSQTALQEGRLGGAALQCAVASLHFALDERNNASSALAAAFTLFEQDNGEPSRMPVHEVFNRTRLSLALTATAAQLALSEGKVQRAFNAANDLERSGSPRARQLAELFRMDAFFTLGSIAPPFNTTAFQGSALVFLQDVFSGSRAPAIARALEGISTGTPDARERVFEALERTEAAARRTPLEAHRAFAQVARAAERCGARSVAVRAELRANDYGAARALAISRVKSADRLESKNA